MPGFFHLPLEIRRYIYGYIFSSKDKTITINQNKGSSFVNPIDRDNYNQVKQLQGQILRVNEAFSEETAQFFWDSLTISVSHYSAGVCTNNVRGIFNYACYLRCETAAPWNGELDLRVFRSIEINIHIPLQAISKGAGDLWYLLDDDIFAAGFSDLRRIRIRLMVYVEPRADIAFDMSGDTADYGRHLMKIMSVEFGFRTTVEHHFAQVSSDFNAINYSFTIAEENIKLEGFDPFAKTDSEDGDETDEEADEEDDEEDIEGDDEQGDDEEGHDEEGHDDEAVNGEEDGDKNHDQTIEP